MQLDIVFTRADFGAILPAATLFVTGVVALLADLFVRSHPREVAYDAGHASGLDLHPFAAKNHLGFIGIGGGLLALAAIGLSKWLAADVPPAAILAGALRVDALGGFASGIIIIAALFTTLSAGPYLATHGQHRGEFHALVWLGAGAMILLAQASNLITLFVAIETLSLSVYVLAGFFRQWKEGSEAAMKYFVMGAFSSGFLLLGMAFLYGATRSINLDALASPEADPRLLVAGLLLVLVGFAFKVGAVPFHSWLPDVYQGAPAIATGWMAVSVKAASFIALLRLVLAASADPGLLIDAGSQGPFPSASGEAISRMVALIAVATMLLGNLVAIHQSSIKRLLAYSAIAHSGYLLIAIYLAFRPTARIEAATSVLFYLVAYLLMTASAFTVIAIVSRGERDREEMAAFNGLAKVHPLLALALTISLLSLTGIPLTAGFFGKLLIFKTAIAEAYGGGTREWDQGLFNIALVGILTSIASAYYYLRPIRAMYFERPGGSLAKVEAPWGMHLMLVITSIATLAIGIFPAKVIEMAAAAARSVAGG